jgi:nucleoside-diphosphate-sugar epimerase
MSRVVIIGGTGHVGTYLVPRLVCAGFEVINISLRIPMKPATHSKRKPATCSDLKPAGIPI